MREFIPADWPSGQPTGEMLWDTGTEHPGVETHMGLRDFLQEIDTDLDKVLHHLESEIIPKAVRDALHEGPKPVEVQAIPVAAEDWFPNSMALENTHQAAALSPASDNRQEITIANQSTNGNVYLGGHGVAAQIGAGTFLLPAGAAVTIKTKGAVYAITDTAGTVVSWFTL